MDDPDLPQKLHRRLEPGELVVLHAGGPIGEFPMLIPVDHISTGIHWFLGHAAPLLRGASLTVQSPIEGDARYFTNATMVACSEALFGLEIDPDWERSQERAFARVPTPGLSVGVVRLSDQTGTTAETTRDELQDLSAGGLSFSATDDFEVGEEVVCHFEPPGSLCFVLPAKVVRAPRSASPGAKTNVSVEFFGIDEANRSQLLALDLPPTGAAASPGGAGARASRGGGALGALARQRPLASLAKRARIAVLAGVSTAASIKRSGSMPSPSSTSRRAST